MQVGRGPVRLLLAAVAMPVLLGSVVGVGYAESGQEIPAPPMSVIATPAAAQPATATAEAAEPDEADEAVEPDEADEAATTPTTVALTPATTGSGETTGTPPTTGSGETTGTPATASPKTPGTETTGAETPGTETPGTETTGTETTGTDTAGTEAAAVGRLVVRVRIGDNPTGTDLGGVRFGVDVRCTATGGETVLEQTAWIAPDRRFTFEDVPAGATCEIWQSDPRGMLTDHDADHPLSVVIATGETEPVTTTATLVNDAPAVPLQVAKKTVGPAAAMVGHHWFDVQVACALQTEEGWETILARELTIRAGQTLPVDDVAPSLICWVDEIGYGQADSYTVDYPVGSPLPVQAGEPAVLTVTNTFAAGHLTVTKRVVGGDVRPTFPMTVTCRTGFGTARLAAGDASFALADGESKVVAVPDRAQCEVAETDVSAGTTVTYTASDGGHDRTVHVVGSAWITVTTTYDVFEADPSDGSSGGSPSTRSSLPELAETGAAVGPLVATGLGLTAAGALLLSLVRRRTGLL